VLLTGAPSAGYRGSHSRRGAGATPRGGVPHCTAAPEQGTQHTGSSRSTRLTAGWQQDSACTWGCAAVTVCPSIAAWVCAAMMPAAAAAAAAAHGSQPAGSRTVPAPGAVLR
jgi:hypothetical protein